MRIHEPVRATHRYTQTLVGPPAAVLPLLCPVREVEWVPGWAPRDVFSASGVAERACAFTTLDGAREATWVVTEHDPRAGRVEMIKVTPGYAVTRLTILVRPRADGGSTAEVAYTYTALGPEGEAYVRSRTPEAYVEFMRDWEDALNAHLGRGPARAHP